MNQDELRKNLSFNIKQCRKLLTMTQEKLAEDTGLSAQTINDIEGCRTWVSDKTLVKLAEVLRTTPAELLLQNTNKQSETLDFLKFKSELQDSVRQTIEEMFEKRKL
ncbi:helix-turn-helix domain-containing protein [Treponema sp.]|uniref:helix-turn-helix domain-containing protein n=1 Tax=Treponema sp. TaxID=166 RepID=UPI0038908505